MHDVLELNEAVAEVNKHVLCYISLYSEIPLTPHGLRA
jgi:hypothetical protein